MDGIGLGAATGCLIEELQMEYGIGQKKARTLLANVLLRYVVRKEIYNMAAYIMEQEKEGGDEHGTDHEISET